MSAVLEREAPALPALDEAATAPEAPLCLRVLGGPLEGAEAAVPLDEAVTIGRGFRNTVVLRDKSVGETRISVEAKGPIVTLRVLCGEAVLLGRRMGAPAQAVLPHYLPVAVGQSSFAIGEPDHPRWDECGAILPLVTAAPANDAGPARQKRSWLPIAALGASAAAALAVVATVSIPREAAAPVVPAIEQARAAISAGGFDEVVVSDSGAEGLLLQGFVATDARRSELRDRLDGLGVDYAARVRSGEAAARQVSDLFAAAGTPGTAAYAGGGRVVVSGVQADEPTADRLRARVLQDVPFLTALDIQRAEPTVRARSAAWTAEIVHSEGGEFAHVVTRDGARFFEGGTTPMGGKIVHIGEGSITIDEEGAATRHLF